MGRISKGEPYKVEYKERECQKESQRKMEGKKGSWERAGTAGTDNVALPVPIADDLFCLAISGDNSPSIDLSNSSTCSTGQFCNIIKFDYGCCTSGSHRACDRSPKAISGHWQGAFRYSGCSQEGRSGLIKAAGIGSAQGVDPNYESTQATEHAEGCEEQAPRVVVTALERFCHGLGESDQSFSGTAKAIYGPDQQGKGGDSGNTEIATDGLRQRRPQTKLKRTNLSRGMWMRSLWPRRFNYS